MSRSGSKLTKMISALGIFSLVLAAWSPRLSAEVSSFSSADYSGRYVCNVTANEDFFTAVIKYNPNGGGGYTAGTLIASDNAFNDSATGATAFCSYTLDTTLSNYTVDGNGLGFEKLVWTASASNDDSCPCADDSCDGTSSFTDQTTFGLRNLTNANGVVIDSEIASVNLLNEAEPGRGYCLK